MNKDRENKITKINSDLVLIKDRINEVYTEEQCVFDNMPENLQSSERGMRSEESIDILGEVVDILEECIEKLEEI